MLTHLLSWSSHFSRTIRLLLHRKPLLALNFDRLKWTHKRKIHRIYWQIICYTHMFNYRRIKFNTTKRRKIVQANFLFIEHVNIAWNNIKQYSVRKICTTKFRYIEKMNFPSFANLMKLLFRAYKTDFRAEKRRDFTVKSR